MKSHQVMRHISPRFEIHNFKQDLQWTPEMSMEQKANYFITEVVSISKWWLYNLHRVLILSDNYHVSLPAATLPSVWVIWLVGYSNTINKLTGSGNWSLSDKIMTLYNEEKSWKLASVSFK